MRSTRETIFTGDGCLVIESEHSDSGFVSMTLIFEDEDRNRIYHTKITDLHLVEDISTALGDIFYMATRRKKES